MEYLVCLMVVAAFIWIAFIWVPAELQNMKREKENDPFQQLKVKAEAISAAKEALKQSEESLVVLKRAVEASEQDVAVLKNRVQTVTEEEAPTWAKRLVEEEIELAGKKRVFNEAVEALETARMEIGRRCSEYIKEEMELKNKANQIKLADLRKKTAIAVDLREMDENLAKARGEAILEESLKINEFEESANAELAMQRLKELRG